MRYKLFCTENGWLIDDFSYLDAVQKAIEISFDEMIQIYNENKSLVAICDDGKLFEYSQKEHPSLENFTFYSGDDCFHYLVGENLIYRMSDDQKLELIATKSLKNTKYKLPKEIEKLWE